jgi:protein involved in polysaccharide export with SLBB domain
MTQKLFLLILLPYTVCWGQSVLTTPIESTRSVQNSTAAASPDAETPNQAFRSGGEKTYTDGAGAKLPPFTTPNPAPSRIVGPLTTKSDFERFAEDGTGRRLPVYGRRLFDEVPTTFAPVERVPVPADYVLGPGDELLIRAWGKIDLDSRVTVDRNGQVYLPKLGTLNVAGLRYDQLEGYLHSAVSALFKDFELNVAMGQLRSIQIFVLGCARQPGSYTVGSLSTLVNALFASGGPSATGTMRHIQLRRGNRTLIEFDVYDLAQKGDKSHDVQLLPGDVIYIPHVGAQVAITGSVNEPGIYELKDEMTVAAALEGAGGLTSLAGAQRALLERIENRNARVVEEFPLDTQGMRRQLADGDLLRIFPLSPKFENAVMLRGSVAQPGRYAWKAGMHVSDLIPSQEFLVTRDFWNGQNELVPGSVDHAFRTERADQSINPRPDQFMNQRSEQSENPRPDQFMDQRPDQFGNQGIDRNTNEHPGQSISHSPNQYENPLTNQLVTARTSMIESVGKNSAEINWEYAVIERLDDQDLSTRLIPFRLASAINDPASGDNQLLKAGDVVTIFSRADLDLPMEKHASFIRVGGEVNAPGVYRVNPGETLRDVVVRAGGLTSHSYLYASRLTRVSTRHAQEEQLKKSSEQMQRELVSKYANAAPSTGQTANDQQAQLGMQQAALARLFAIQPTGQVVLQMKPEAASVSDIPDLPIEDQDAFYVPARLSTVQVTGAVYNANAFRHQAGRQLYAYLNDAGGPTRDADTKRIFVIRADGTVVSKQSRSAHLHGDFEKLRLFPGDAIVVPERFKAPGGIRGIQDFTQIISQSALTAAALGAVLP